MARMGSRFPPEPAAGGGREAEKDTGETTNSAGVTAREREKKEPSVSSEQWKPRRLQLPYRRTPARNRAQGQGQVMNRNEDEARAYTWHTYLLSTSISVIVMHAQASIGPPL